MSRLVPRKARSPIASPVHQDVPLPDGTEQGQDASPQERIRRLATKTIDLGKCITGRPHPPPSPASKGPRRIANTNKKGKGKETSGEDPTEGDRLSYCGGETISIGHKPSAILPHYLSLRVANIHPFIRCPLLLQVMIRPSLGLLHHHHILHIVRPYKKFKA